MSARSGLAGKKKPRGPHLGPSQAIFCVGRKIKKNVFFSLIFAMLRPLVNSKELQFLSFFRSMEKLARNSPKWGQEVFFPTNPDLADILGRTDLDFENFHFLFVWIPNFWISRFIDFQNLAWAGLGPWSHPGPRGLGGPSGAGGFFHLNQFNIFSTRQ